MRCCRGEPTSPGRGGSVRLVSSADFSADRVRQASKLDDHDADVVQTVEHTVRRSLIGEISRHDGPVTLDYDLEIRRVLCSTNRHRELECSLPASDQRTLARGHARTGDRVAIASYLGSADVFDRAMADFAALYADQNDRDYERVKSATNGRGAPTEPASAPSR